MLNCILLIVILQRAVHKAFVLLLLLLCIFFRYVHLLKYGLVVVDVAISFKPAFELGQHQ